MSPVKSVRLLDFLSRKGFSPAMAASLMLDGKVNLLGRQDKPMHQARDPGISALAGDRISIELNKKEALAGIKAGFIQPEQIRPSSRPDRELLIWTIDQDDCHIKVGLHRENETKEIRNRQERLKRENITIFNLTSLERRFLREKYGQRRGQRIAHGKEPLPEDAFAGLRPPSCQPIRIEISELQADHDLSDCWEKAMSAQVQNEHDIAINNYANTLQLERDQSRIAIILYNMGVSFCKSGKHYEALERYGQALEQNPNMPEAINNIAFIHNHLSSLADAKGDRSLAEYHRHQAARYWEKAIELNPDKHLEAMTWLESNYRNKLEYKANKLNTILEERMTTPRASLKHPKRGQDDEPINLSLQDAYALFWRNTFQFNGRISRRNFWKTVLANTIAFTGIVFTVAFFSALAGAEISPAWSVLLTIYGLAMGVASVSLQIRRIRDTGLSPWLILILFVPYVGSFIGIAFYILPSKKQSSSRSSQDPTAKPVYASKRNNGTRMSTKNPDDELEDLAIHQNALEASLKKIREKNDSQ